MRHIDHGVPDKTWRLSFSWLPSEEIGWGEPFEDFEFSGLLEEIGMSKSFEETGFEVSPEEIDLGRFSGLCFRGSSG